MPNNQPTENGVSKNGAAAVAVRELITGVRQGEPLRVGNLTLVPLLPAAEQVQRRTGYLPLGEALQSRLIEISEKAQASVPELLATSTAEVPIILVGGEQVIGGLQNRVLNTTILVAAHTSLHIPVTCVESGRWHESSAYHETPSGTGDTGGQSSPPSFSSHNLAYAKMRRMHTKYVSESLSSGRGHSSDQGAVWGEVSARMMSTDSYSPSAAMETLYSTPERASKLKEAIEHLQQPQGALGFVAILGNHILGAELFADETLARAYWEKLATTYAVEALDARPHDAGETSAPDATTAPGDMKLLQEALAADIQIHPSPGLGADARLVGNHVTGAGLVYDGAVVHLSLFPDDAAEGSTQPQTHHRRYGGHRQV